MASKGPITSTGDILAADYNMDPAVSKFYYYYDQLERTKALGRFGNSGGRVHTNEYLALPAPCLECWNPAGCRIFHAIQFAAGFIQCQPRLSHQRTHRGYHSRMPCVTRSDRVVVARMQVDDPKCNGKLSCTVECPHNLLAQGLVWLCALLPIKHWRWRMTSRVLVDGILCDNLTGRRRWCKAIPGYVCVQFDDYQNLKVAELRDLLTKRQIIYVYHRTQIDARGDRGANTEGWGCLLLMWRRPFRKSWTWFIRSP